MAFMPLGSVAALLTTWSFQEIRLDPLPLEKRSAGMEYSYNNVPEYR